MTLASVLVDYLLIIKVKIIFYTAHDCPPISPEFLEDERQALGDWWFRQ